MASESTPVEQGQDFATSAGNLERKEISELSDISIENVATTRSPTDNAMMHGVTQKPEMSSSFSERVKNTLETSFHLSWERVQAMKQKSRKRRRKLRTNDFETQISPNSSTQENEVYTNRETGSTDLFVVSETISKITNGLNQSGNFVNLTNPEVLPGKTEMQGQVTHQRIRKRIMKKRRGREVRLESRPAPSCLESIGLHHHL